TDFTSVTHTYSARQYFPVVTVVTSLGRFSSDGGWNSGDPNRLRINVQAQPQQIGNAISVTDPIDLKCTSDGKLYVLSRSSAAITEFNANGGTIRHVQNIGNT